MKKVILTLAFVLATGTTFMNATGANDEFIETKTDTIETVDDFGCARDCVDSTLVFFGDIPTEDPGNQTIMDLYLAEYERCLGYKCGIYA